jgi:hypothetical protein
MVKNCERIKVIEKFETYYFILLLVLQSTGCASPFKRSVNFSHEKKNSSMSSRKSFNYFLGADISLSEILRSFSLVLTLIGLGRIKAFGNYGLFDAQNCLNWSVSSLFYDSPCPAQHRVNKSFYDFFTVAFCYIFSLFFLFFLSSNQVESHGTTFFILKHKT